MNKNTILATNRKMVLQASVLSFALGFVVVAAFIVFVAATKGSGNVSCYTLQYIALFVPFIHISTMAIGTAVIFALYKSASKDILSPPPPLQDDEGLWWYPAGNGLYRPGKPGRGGGVSKPK
jgi:hypothetical protein